LLLAVVEVVGVAQQAAVEAEVVQVDSVLLQDYQ
jgi:hypothetical protein